MREPTSTPRIWAPNAKHVEIVVGGQRIAATADLDGWWRAPPLGEGDDYQVSVDGGAPRPDPRSRWQPSGVHGPSRWIDLDPERVGFEPPSLADAVIYELHAGTFTRERTFAAVCDHLDHLVELGVTHVELMPIAQFPGRHGWGYDGVGLFAPHAAYGGPSGLRALVRALHARGLAVLIDVVHNHFGPEGAYGPELAPYETDRHRTPWGKAINLDGEHAREVRRFMIDSALTWLRDYGADGLRLDALHSLRDESDRHFVAELVDEVHGLGRQLQRRFVLIGEYDDHDPMAVTERSSGGWGLDAHWNDDLHHAVHALLTRETQRYYADFAEPGTLAKILERGYALDGGYSSFRGEHHGKPFGDVWRDRLVAYVQSHDQVGNRAWGERLHHLCGIDRAKLAAAILMCAPFVPMVFQGEEWAASTPFLYFADLEDPELREACRKGRREEHGIARGPDPFAVETLEASTLHWDERHDGEHASMLAWYRTLISARHRYHELRDPRPEATRAITLDGGGLAIERGDLALLCNFSGEAMRVEAGDVLLASTGGTSHRELPPVSCALVRRA